MDAGPWLVSDVMTHSVVALRRGAEFKDIVAAMRRWDVSALPVIDDEHRLLGVVSQADLLLKEEFREGEADRSTWVGRRYDLTKAGARTAGELMTVPAVTAEVDDTLARAARIMAHCGVKRLPVVDADGVLKGIVSRSDLLKVFLRADENIAEEVRGEVAVLFPDARDDIRVQVRDGVVKITGRVRDTSLVPVVKRLAQAVEGVVGVDCELLEPRRRSRLDPDFPCDTAAVRSPGASRSS